jgi:hypothetical protein
MTRIGFVLLLFLGVPVLAASPGNPIPFLGHPDIDSIVVPQPSPVHFTGWLKGDFPAAQFKGRFLLTGTYYYSDGAFNDGPEFTGEAVIFPDNPGMLPQFVKRNGEHKIGIDNPSAFATAVIPADTLRKVSRKGGGYATGHVAIWAEGFTVSIVCDSPSYGTHFVSMYKPAGVRLARSMPDVGC